MYILQVGILLCIYYRWVKFDYTGDMFYTGITNSAQYK